MTLPYLLPQDWTARAACRGCPSDDFFPAADDPAEAAKSVCRRCPAQAPCLDHALRYREAGVWGATTERERTRMRRAALDRAVADERAPRVPKQRRA